MEKLTARVLNSHLTYLFGNEIEYLENLAKQLGSNARVVILGGGPGLCSLSLLSGNPTLDILAVDHNPAVVSTYEKHLEAAGFPSKVWIGDTLEPLEIDEFNFKDRPVNLLIIDADHSRFAVKRDFTGWFHKVAVGGYVFFHDYIDLEQNGTNGVRADILEIESLYNKDIKFIDQPGISYVVQKVKR